MNGMLTSSDMGPQSQPTSQVGGKQPTQTTTSPLTDKATDGGTNVNTTAEWDDGAPEDQDAALGWSDSDDGPDTKPPNTNGLTVRDFAYPATDDRHYGIFPSPKHGRESDYESDSATEWAEINAAGELVLAGLVKALYDFKAENPSEVSFKESEILYIQYKQCEGWFVGYVNGQVGLIPENYVQFMRNS
ncbi:HOG (high osmolarity glycerol) pathway protein [Dimargaris verticillata]|uniref:HOG (High osmolarity glycerol) pathway protein n=1 Tax=Dimargaris verticillata TaxID=2761393 RepID=A0A9W8B905_9FUNG|nr:HOG (high osmolarity glycerol) pathway protein [Dimargaris verticillata]